ncbi:hypothetical protein PINS_up015768 [Pythium insidiosum]|nr:hypothetical protein PINS_up015768 [Pythium insidiosum]
MPHSMRPSVESLAYVACTGDQPDDDGPDSVQNTFPVAVAPQMRPFATEIHFMGFCSERNSSARPLVTVAQTVSLLVVTPQSCVPSYETCANVLVLGTDSNCVKYTTPRWLDVHRSSG